MLRRLHHLPRDARDTLFLLAVIAWVIAPQVNHLPLWCTSMAALVLGWRGWIAVRGSPLPARGWLMFLLLVAAMATWFSHRTLLGQQAGVTMIVVLLSLKTLEMRARRDAFVIFFLGFFTLLSNFFHSQSLLTAVFMLVGVIGLLAAVINSHMPVGRPPLARITRQAAWMALLGTPIMVLLFVLFPRIAPLWGLPADAQQARSGLSDRMQVGSVAQLALDSSVAMRLQFEGAAPEPQTMYFRGPTLSAFDGKEWRQSPASSSTDNGPENLQTQGPAVRYQVILEARNQPWVFALEATATATATALADHKLRQTADLQWLSDRPLDGLVRYHAQSHPQFRYGPRQVEQSLLEYVQLPFDSNPLTQQMARQIRSHPRYARADSLTLVNAVLEQLRTGGYRYTLSPGVFGKDSADEFWFTRKQGFCEHIASSFVILMRAMGVPARIVTGYQGAERNPIDGWYTVRQSDAHAWAEVWMPGQGWLRVDPTTAVAPDRASNLRLSPPGGALTQALVTVNAGWAFQLRSWWDAANNRWNQWVLNYNQTKQFNLLRNLGFDTPDWQDLASVLIFLIGGAGLGWSLWAWWQRQRQDPWLRLLQQTQRRLRRAGIIAPAHATPRQLAALLQSDKAAPLVTPEERETLCRWLLQLESWRYNKTAPNRNTLGTLQREWHQLPWPRPRKTVK